MRYGVFTMYTPRYPVKRRLFATPASAKRFRSTPAAFTPGATDSTVLSAHRTFNKTTGRAPRRSGTLKQQVRSLQTWVKKHNPEVKYKDVTCSVSNVTSAGSAVLVSDTSQGSTGVTRTGSEINITSIAVRCNLVATTDSTSRFHHRVVLVLDKDSNGAVPTAANIFTDGVYTGSPISLLPNLTNLERFKILAVSELKDNAMGFNANVDTGATQSNVVELNWRGNYKVVYQPASNSAIKNAIWLFYLTTSSADTVDWTGVARVAFNDA